MRVEPGERLGERLGVARVALQSANCRIRERSRHAGLLVSGRRRLRMAVEGTERVEQPSGSLVGWSGVPARLPVYTGQAGVNRTSAVKTGMPVSDDTTVPARGPPSAKAGTTVPLLFFSRACQGFCVSRSAWVVT